MTTMKRFIYKLFILVAIPGLLFCIPFTFNRHEQPVNLVQQHENLVSKASPKLVFVGGSNALFGIDSERLEKGIKLQVVNYSVQGGLPVSFYFREVLPYLSEGDIVLLVFEYGYYYGVIRPEALARIVDRYPAGIPSLLPEYWMDTPSILKTIFLDRVSRLLTAEKNESDDFDREYNQWGDAIYLLDYNGHTAMDRENGTLSPVSEVDRSVIEKIRKFSEEAQKKGASVVITYPSMWERQYKPQKELISDLDQYLREQFPGMVVSKPLDYVFESVYVSDTSFHLNREGRQIRTDRMIEDLARSGLLNLPSTP